LVKDNHLASGSACSGLSLESKVRQVVDANPGVAVEVEVDHLDQIEAVLDGGAHIIMLDNFCDEDLVCAKDMIQGRAVTEVSGGITEERLRRIAPIGLDFASCGGLVHQSRWVDIGLDWIS
ncbi:MAG TPA: nicotinate-nucleotide diphosphorylase (carboxylating), partial [Opitutales bacterium]|nr:nicotinate-nucleotide diphosphorylase (carboxylating) [Opitutales bacterium]